MPGIDVGNVFGKVLSNPLTAAGNWFGGGLSRVAEGGGEDDSSLQFLADTMRTGQPVTSEPRTGLLSFISPTMKADPRTQYLEQVLLHQKAQEDFKTKIGAIGVFEDLVNQLGGDRAIKMAPAVFGDILQDPNILQAFAGVKAKGDASQQRFLDQAALQEQGFQNWQRKIDYERDLGIGPFKPGKENQGRAPFEDAAAHNLFSSLMKPRADLDPTAINENIDKAKKFIDIYSKGRGKDSSRALSDALDAIKPSPAPPVDMRSWWARHFGTSPLGTGTAEAEPGAQPQPSAEATPNLGF